MKQNLRSWALIAPLIVMALLLVVILAADGIVMLVKQIEPLESIAMVLFVLVIGSIGYSLICYFKTFRESDNYSNAGTAVLMFVMYFIQFLMLYVAIYRMFIWWA